MSISSNAGTMNKIVYLVGRTVDSRQSLLAENMARSAHHSFLHLVPTRGRVMELEVGSRFWPKERVETLSRVIYQIFDEHLRFEQFKDYRPINEAQRLLLIKKVLETRGMQPDGLTYFSRLLSSSAGQDNDFSGIYKSISGFFSLILRNNFQDRFVEDLGSRIIRLEEESPGTGEKKYALESDLTWLFADFEEIKRDIKVYDDDDILSSVRTYLRDGGDLYASEDWDVLVLDGFIHFSRVEEDILFNLCPRFLEVWWLLDYDSQVKDPIESFKEAVGREHSRERGVEEPGRYEAYRILTPLVSLMQRLEKTGFVPSIEKAEDMPFSHPVAGLYAHGHLEKTSNEGLKIKSFADRVDEVRAIASEIKRIIHEEGLGESQDIGKIRVIFPDLNDYSSLISEIFAAYNVPFSLTKGLPLTVYPITHIFYTIFEIPLNHFTRKDIFRLFSSPLIKKNVLNHLPGKERLSRLKKEYLFAGQGMAESARKGLGHDAEIELDIFLFDQVARKCGLNKLGGDFSWLWEEGLLRVRDYYQDRFFHTKIPKKRKDILSEYYGFLAQVELLERGLVFFKTLSNQRNPQKIVDGVFQILDLLGFPGNLVHIPEKRLGHGAEKRRSMISRDIKAYTLLEDLVLTSANEVRLAGELFGISDGDALLSRLYSVFKSALGQAYLLDARNPNVVRVSEWLEMRGRSFECIFAGGLIADKFPLKDAVDFILPEALNKAIRIRDPIGQSKYLFSHLVRNCRKRLHLSFPRYTNEKEVQPSPVLSDLESMVQPLFGAEGSGQTLEELFKWEENPYFASEEELLDATRVKNQPPSRLNKEFFPLGRIIVKRESLSGALLRTINTLRSRWAQDGLFDHDGLVGKAVRFSAYSQGKSDLSSPSLLETLANCPMRYLFEHVYGLDTLEEQGPEVSGRDMGAHIHFILKSFYERLRREEKNVADIGIDRAFSLAKDVADDYLSSRPFLDNLEFYEFQNREFLLGLDSGRVGMGRGAKEREGLFAQLLRFEEREFRDRLPGGVEHEFGRKTEIPLLLGETKIQGYVDRFDIIKGDEGKVFIYDYKTGSIPTSDMVKKGLSFQLPAYIHALRSEYQFKGFSAAFYALKRDEFIKEHPLRQRMNDHWEGVGGLDLSGVCLIEEYADSLMRLIGKGYFHHSTDGLKCRFCGFKYACYRDMRRMDHLIHSDEDHRIYSGKENLKKWKKVDEFRKGWKGVCRSMEKAFSLKTESGRRRHFDIVMEYRDWLKTDDVSLPFYREYLEELLQEVNEFENAYLRG